MEPEIDHSQTQRQKKKSLEVVLARFRCLEECWKGAGSPDLKKVYIGPLLEVFRDQSIDFDLEGIESVLSKLLARFTSDDLSEQIRDLFAEGSSENKKKRRWQKSLTELYALAHFQDVHALHSLGWPEGDGDTAPFDLRIHLSGVVVPCDVKSAIGSGFMLVFDTVRGLVDKWATTNGFKGVEFTLSYRGTVSQEVIGPALMRKGLLERFQAELQGHSAIPSQPLTLDLQTVRVQVNLSDGKRMRTSDGIQGTESLASSLVPTYESHVAHKAKSAAKHGATPFALVYIQTPGTGMSDFKTSSIFGMAISRVFARDSNLMNKADTLWLGAVLLDYRHEIPKTTCFLRPNAGWPDGLSPDRFAHGLKGSLTLI